MSPEYRESTIARLMRNVVRVPESGCWLWEGAVSKLGYGRIAFEGKAKFAHRVAFTTLVGEVPDGMELDHLCKVRSCVNPYHLEPVTRLENMKRSGAFVYRQQRSHCPKGHELTEDNKYFAACSNKYLCRACLKARKQRHLLKKAGA
jgi:hypothetical protein